jgi:uncharacterized lipoprotein
LQRLPFSGGAIATARATSLTDKTPPMAHHTPSTTDQTLTCPRCGERIPLTSALRSEIERGLKAQYDQSLVDQAPFGRAHNRATAHLDRVALAVREVRRASVAWAVRRRFRLLLWRVLWSEH